MRMRVEFRGDLSVLPSSPFVCLGWMPCLTLPLTHIPGVVTFLSSCAVFLFVNIRSCASRFIDPPSRLRKRAKQSRKMSSVLAVPKDDRGEVIHLHTAAYNGKQDGLKAYISQGGDLEASSCCWLSFHVELFLVPNFYFNAVRCMCLWTLDTPAGSPVITTRTGLFCQ